MRPRNFLLPILALVGLILFFCLLTRLLLLRYERGDIYPAYSTLRADPLGTRAFFEALDSLPQYEVNRGFKSLHRELEAKPGTLFYLGFDSYEVSSFSKDEVTDLDAFVKNGGRVVITFSPRQPETLESDNSDKSTDKKAATAITPPKKDTAKSDSKPSANQAAPVPAIKADEDIAKAKTEEERYERDQFHKEKEEEAKNNPGHPNELAEEKYELTLTALWGFGFDVAKATDKDKDTDSRQNDNSSDSPPAKDKVKPEVLAERLEEGNVEESVPWKSALYFVRLETNWQRIYDAKFKPVLIRRKWGKGEIIVATDSYFISNEGLRNSCRPALLGLLTGPPAALLFDETHLGTEEQDGVMVLAEKFRLEGYLYGMLAVVLLFLWRNSVPLVPPRPTGQHARIGGVVSGKDSRSGLVNLLRRNIATADILKTSFVEWRRSATAGRQQLHGKAAEMEAVFASATGARAETIVQSYHQLRESNTPRRAKGNYATKS